MALNAKATRPQKKPSAVTARHGLVVLCTPLPLSIFMRTDQCIKPSKHMQQDCM